MNDICVNCGGWKGLHHWQTGQCPFRGQEAPVGQEQLWLNSTFKAEDGSESRINELVDFVRMIADGKNWLWRNGELVWNDSEGNEFIPNHPMDTARDLLKAP
jgi:hypothetical protein